MGIEVKNIHKHFGSFVALDNVSLSVNTGELVALLGPSGSGKTTLLRIIAGMEFADQGEVFLNGNAAHDKAAGERNVGFVFQHYALFRHMSVFDNIAFGLTVRPKAQRPTATEIRNRVFKLLEMVHLESLHDRFPHQLSGGQRQRVALARALAVEPKLLLLDEPFGALDAKVRQELRRWLRRLHDEIHLTSVFVTHDQEEAMRMSDRIAVFNAGAIEQIGTPQQVYEKPESTFVARFLGVSNVFSGQAAQEIFGSSATINIRPERIKLVSPDNKPQTGESGVVGTIIEASYIGATTIFLIQTESGQKVIATRLNEELPDQINRFATGDRVGAVWKSDHSAVIPT